MKKFIMIISVTVAILFGNHARAYDFSAVCSTGQTLYYNITSDTESYTVEVTYQIEGSYSNNYTYYETYPTGDLEIPESVEYNSITYSVTSIGENAFRGCSELTSVNIPDIVTNIGYSAFMGCGSLTGSLIIPDLVTDIGNSAFSDCTGLTSLTLGNSVIYIGNSAFSGCSGLTSVTIPNSVNTIFSEAFYGCDGLISVNYNGDIEGWCNISFDEYGNPVSYAHNLYINNELLTNLIIPETITRINAYLFTGDTCITSLTIPNSITSIGKYAFDSCSALTSITMGTGVESIGENAFRNTGWYNNQPDGVLYLDNWCLGYKGNQPTGDLVLEEGTKGIVREAFSNCSGITSVTIPSSVERISGWSFNGLGEITLNFNATNCTLMGGDEDNPVFINTTITTLNIGENVRTIPDYAFYNCSGITNVTIPDAVESIGDEAFYIASDLTYISLGTGVMYIGKKAFNSTVWYENQSEGILYLDNWCLGYKGDPPTGGITFADGTLGIASDAFYNCENLTSVTIPNSVMSIGSLVFNYCSGLTTVNFNATNCVTMGQKNGQDYPVFNGCNSFSNLNIGENVTNIPDIAFWGCIELTGTLTIPNSVTNIGNSAFSGCNGLTNITISESATNIGNMAFSSCSGLTSITIPESVENIGEMAFWGCSGLTSITIPESVESIGDMAFYGCNELNTVNFNATNCVSMNSSFADCEALSTLNIGENVTNIPEYAFIRTYITNINAYPYTPPTIDNSSFETDVFLSANVYTPCEAAESYRNDNGWWQFENIQGDTTVNFSITVQSQNETMGSVTGGATFTCEEEATLTATPNEGYQFVQWNDGNTDNPRTVIVTADSTFTAGFRAAYTVTVQANNEAYGFVSGGGTYEEGSTATISATPNQGYRFVSWDDGNTDDIRTITVTSDSTFVANFEEEEQRYTITALANNEEYGAVTGGGTYNEGDTVTLMAIQYDGYCFMSWDDGNEDNPRAIIVTSDSTFIAYFSEPIHFTIDTIVQNFVTIGDHTFYSTGNYTFAIPTETGCDTIYDIRLRVLSEPVYDIGPNPTKSLLYINSDGFISAVEFYSVAGQLVMRKEVNGYEVECDVEGLVDGVYVLRIYGAESSLPSVFKIVKE